MRRDLPADDQVTVVMERVLAQAAQNGRRATVTAVERALGIPHATFDRNYRHLTEDFRQRAQQQATAAGPAGPAGAGDDPGQVMQRPPGKRGSPPARQDLRRVDTPAHLGPPRTRSQTQPAAGVTTLADRRNC